MTEFIESFITLPRQRQNTGMHKTQGDGSLVLQSTRQPSGCVSIKRAGKISQDKAYKYYNIA